MIKIKSYLILSLVFLSLISNSQNLVPNPSFEEYYSIPSNINEIQKCKYWYTPRGLSPDFFHSEAITPEYNYTSPVVSVPKNIFGYQKAKTGNAYVGITTFDFEYYTFREMVAVKLNKKLTKDLTYKISFYVNLAESSKYYHNFFDITLSHDSLAKVKTKNGYGKVIAKNSIKIKADSIENDTANWHLIQTKYIAKGGEQYLYIGITKKNINRLRFWTTKCFRKTGWGDEPYAYYYLDDVSVVELNEISVE